MRENCPLCGKRPLIWGLLDKDGIICGRYCSKGCATMDAYGPRFSKYKVQKQMRRKGKVDVRTSKI